MQLRIQPWASLIKDCHPYLLLPAQKLIASIYSFFYKVHMPAVSSSMLEGPKQVGVSYHRIRRKTKIHGTVNDGEQSSKDITHLELILGSSSLIFGLKLSFLRSLLFCCNMPQQTANFYHQPHRTLTSRQFILQPTKMSPFDIRFPP